MTFQKITAHLALLAVCLIAIVPFASRIHYVPLPQWFGEINVIWLLLVAALCLLPSGRLFDALPRASWWCLALAAAWALQPQWVALLFPGMNYVTALAWLALALLASVVASLRGLWGERSFSTALAWALIVGGMVQSLIGLAQLTGLAPVLGLFYDGSHPTGNVFGHIGQRNQFAHYLMWSVLAGCYLFAIGRLSRLWLSLLVVWLAFMLAVAGSRTILLYLLVLSALAWLWHWRIQDKESSQLRWAVLASCLVILLMQLLLPALNQLISLLVHADVHSASGLERLAASSDGMGSRRFAEMHKAWLVFLAHPLGGVGWSQFAAESVRLQPLPEFMAAGFNSGLFTHSHNLILQLLAEMGGVISALVLLGFVWVIWPFFSHQAKPEGLLALGCLAVTLTHSMLEYPLWYYYFLAMLVIFSAMAPRTSPAIISWPWRLPMLLTTVYFAWLSLSSLSLFWEMVDLSTPTNNTQRDLKRRTRLAELVQTQPLFAFHALYSLDDYLAVSHDDLAQKLLLEQRLTAFRPYPDVMLKRAQLEILAGKPQQAEVTLQTTLASFPTYAQQFLQTLDDDKPEWEPLRKIARQAYEQLPAKYKSAEEDE
ncbi:Wzy polymerase domain-containing protein [Neisseriaceae bacterium TC5R-5]|nr:Wzy polymerase domain-containing protein [Neisseriaceae bacterium TC5R-5]